jgi:uncharacterized protein YdhG (YjbR/CyaY superfamily)
MAPNAAKKTTARKTTATKASSEADTFTDEERGAMKERARELRARRGGKSTKADDEQAVRDKIAEMGAADREMAERVHAVITGQAPELDPKLWYGMPAYAKNGKIVCFFQPADKFKARYATLGFNDPAKLDDGDMWPVAYAVTTITKAVEKQVVALVKKAAG